MRSCQSLVSPRGEEVAGGTATLGLILAKKGRISDMERAQTSGKHEGVVVAPGREKVGLLGLKKVLVRKFIAK